MKDFILVLMNPKKLFSQVKEENKFSFFTLLFVLLGIIIYHILSTSSNDRIIELTLAATGLKGDQLEIATNAASKMKYITIVGAIIMNVVMFLLYALILQVGIKLNKVKVNYGIILQIIVFSYIVIVIGDIINVLIVNQIGVENIYSQYDIYKIGLNHFFNSQHVGGALYTFLYYINPFQLWFIILIILGIKAISDIQLSKAVILTLVFWLITVAIPVIMVCLGEIASSKAGVM